MSTFGVTSPQASWTGDLASGFLIVSKFTLTEDADFSTISLYLRSGTGADAVWRAIIYDNDGAAGIPSTKLFESPDQTLTSGSSAAYKAVSCSALTGITAGDYYLGFCTRPGGAIQVNYAAGGDDYYESYDPASGAPNPVVGLTHDTNTITAFVTYSAPASASVGDLVAEFGMDAFIQVEVPTSPPGRGIATTVPASYVVILSG